MSTVPVGDVDLLAMTPQQFFELMQEDKPQQVCRAPASSTGPHSSWDAVLSPRKPTSPFAPPRPDPIYPVNPLAMIDRANDWLKDNTYIDMFGWKDAIVDGRTAVRQVMLLGIKGDAYLKKTKSGAEVVIFKGYAGLREKLPGTRYLRDNPVVHAANFVIGHKEMLEEAGKATKVAIVVFIAWDIVHECLQDKPDMTRLGISIISDIFQAVAATYIGVGAGLIAVAFGAPVVLAFCVVATATLLAGVGFTLLDKHFELTKKAVDLAKRLEKTKAVESFVDFANSMAKSYAETHASPFTYLSY